MFSWPNKWEHASFGRNKTSIELARKNLADVHCKWEHASFGRNKTSVELARTKEPCRPTLYIFYATPKHENKLPLP